MTYAGKETSKISITTALIDPVDPTLVIFSWDEPTYLGGLTINSYLVEIKSIDGTYFTRVPECDGTLTDVISARECRVSQLDLMAEPFSLI